MKHIYAFENVDEYIKYQGTIERFSTRLAEYQHILEEDYALTVVPKGIVWTTEELATTIFSDIPIPAYTTGNLIYMSPDSLRWREIFLKQLDGEKRRDIEKFYENFSENQLFTIIAHELTHHSDLFLDGFSDERKNSIWFEEGMCQYLPRKILLNNKEFEEITKVEFSLMGTFQDKYGSRSLDAFGSSSYRSNLSSIMFDYWRSYHAVKSLVEIHANGDIKLLFDEYHNWDRKGRKEPLTTYFEIDRYFDEPRMK